SAHNIADALAALELIQCASAPDLDIGAPQIDANEIDGPGATRVSELTVRYARGELAGCCNSHRWCMHRGRARDDDQRCRRERRPKQPHYLSCRGSLGGCAAISGDA